MIRRTAPAPGLTAGTPPRVEPPAAPLGEEHHQVDEGEPEAADDDRFAGREHRQVVVGRVGGRQMYEPVPPGEPGQLLLFRVRSRVEMAEGQHDEVGGDRSGHPFQPHLLGAVGGAADPYRAGPVLTHRGARRQRGHGLLVHPAQIAALFPPGGEGLRVGPGPLGEVGARAHGPCQRVRGRVGEHRHVRRHGVHPQQRGLVLPPDPPSARRVGVDQVDVEGLIPVQRGGVGGEPLQDSGPARPGADHRDGRRHRAPRA